MGIKYVGRTTTYKGKPLWEILANLKNFGVGRIVVRSQFQRYPEPCYMKILKVAALPNANANFHDPRKVVALVERTFRGTTEEKPVQIDKSSYKADYVLIPKDEEAKYVNATARPPPCRIMPETVEFPPLLKELLIQQAKDMGQENIKELKLKMRYNLTGYAKRYKIVDKDETPTENIKILNSTELYLNDTQKKAKEGKKDKRLS